MKFRLPPLLFSALISCLGVCFTQADGQAPTNLGNVMYVGDSITHGVNSASYRWALFKIFTDNGIANNSVGVTTGNYSGGVSAGTTYAGKTFNNKHSSVASERASNISGRVSSGRLGGTGIKEWLGLSATSTSYKIGANETPDTYFMMIGTNDILSDAGGPATYASKTQNLLGTYNGSGVKTADGDMDVIVKAMLQKNPDSSIIVTSIPCWTNHSNSNTADYHTGVSEYNAKLQTWANEYTNVTYVDVNKGMIDVSSSTPFYGVSSMFNNPGSDGLHPNAQGDLIIAGNIAKGLGYAGRSVGQDRLAASGMAVNFYGGGSSPAITAAALSGAGFTANNVSVANNAVNFGNAGSSSLNYSWSAGTDLSYGFSTDFLLQFGDGSSNGWSSTDQFSVSMGNGVFYGTLNVTEAYIKWGNTILYSTDMSANTDNIRISYINANASEGIAGGYYVWLGDVLIGEALSTTGGSVYDGVSFSYSGSLAAYLKDIALDGSGSYAPTSTGVMDPSNAYSADKNSVPVFSPTNTPQGNITWKTSDFTASNNNLTASGTYNARAAVDGTAGGAGKSVGATITSGNTTIIYANSGNYTGDAWLTISNQGGASSWYAGHGAAGTLTGDAYLRFTDNAVGGSTVFGAVNAEKLNGSVYLEFSAENAAFGSFTNTNQSSVVGSYQTDITGDVNIVVNAGTFNYQIIGGFHSGGTTSNKSIGGSTDIYINGGTVKSDVSGGGFGGTIKGGTNVTVSGGTITGNVYGAGKGGTIEGNSDVVIRGGTIGGDIYAGGTAGTLNGNSSLTIEGDKAQLGTTAKWSKLSAGGSGGTILGNSILTIKNLRSGNSPYGMDKFAGTISGGTNVAGTRTLVLDNVVLSSFDAALTDFDIVQAVNGTSMQLTSLGGASRLEMDASTNLIINSSVTLTDLIMGNNAALMIVGFDNNVLIDITSANSFVISLSSIPINVDNITFKKGEDYFSAVLQIDYQAGSAMVLADMGMVPEPTTSALGLLGIAALSFRRGRKKQSV